MAVHGVQAAEEPADNHHRHDDSEENPQIEAKARLPRIRLELRADPEPPDRYANPEEDAADSHDGDQRPLRQRVHAADSTEAATVSLMEAATLQFELEEFEYLPATTGTALVRVAGKWRADAEQELPPMALLVWTPLGDDRVTPLPDANRDGATADAEGLPWRAAFSLAIHVLTSGEATFLLAGEGVEVELPA